MHLAGCCLFTHSKTDGAHARHRKDIEPGTLDPLTEGRSSGKSAGRGLNMITVALVHAGVTAILLGVRCGSGTGASSGRCIGVYWASPTGEEAHLDLSSLCGSFVWYCRQG